MNQPTLAGSVIETLPDHLLTTLKNGLRPDIFERRIPGIHDALVYCSVDKELRQRLFPLVEKALSDLPEDAAKTTSESLLRKFEYVLDAKRNGIDSILSVSRRYDVFRAEWVPHRHHRGGDSVSPVTSIMKPRSATDRSFKDFNPNEIVWEGEWLCGAPKARIYTNAFPFRPNHVLLVPNHQEERGQIMTLADLKFACKVMHLCDSSSKMYIFWNCYGAHASIHCMHFHLCECCKLAIEDARFAHNDFGGDEKYPLDVHVFASPEECFRKISELQARGQAHSLVLSARTKKMYLVTRAMQGRYLRPEYVSGIASVEASGLLLVNSRHALDLLDDARIGHCLALARS